MKSVSNPACEFNGSNAEGICFPRAYVPVAELDQILRHTGEYIAARRDHYWQPGDPRLATLPYYDILDHNAGLSRDPTKRIAEIVGTIEHYLEPGQFTQLQAIQVSRPNTP